MTLHICFCQAYLPKGVIWEKLNCVVLSYFTIFEQDMPFYNVTLVQDDGEIITKTYLSTGRQTSRKSQFLTL